MYLKTCSPAKRKAFKLLSIVYSLWAIVFFSVPLHAGEVDENYLLRREEEIRLKQARIDDFNYKIEALHQQLEREQEQLKTTNEKIWKEFSQNLDIERRELKEKIDAVSQRQTQFENELERKRELDQIRLREKDNELKRMMLDAERLRREIEEDGKVFEDLKRSYKDRTARAESLKQAGAKEEPASEVLKNGAVSITKMSGNQLMGHQPFSVKNVQQEYNISIGDILGIEVWRNQDLTRRATVRPDGRISLPLAGDLDVVGLSLVELRQLIADRLKNYIRDPQVTISLDGFGGRKFVILGEISSPGVYRFQESITLLEAIALAGGFTKASHQGKVMIIRGDIRKQPQVKIIAANASNILRRGMLTENLTIMPNDIIFLGRDFVGDYREFISEVVQPTMAVTTDFFVTRSAIRTARMEDSTPN